MVPKKEEAGKYFIMAIYLMDILRKDNISIKEYITAIKVSYGYMAYLEKIK